MYVLYCLLILTFVYTLPALACMPKLIYSPLTAFSIPIISTFIIYGLSTILIAFNCFQPTVVMMFSLGIGIIAIKRLIRLFQSKSLSWLTRDKRIYLFHAILLLPYLIKLGTHGFDRGDEIYSWNFWALQHVFHETIDFSHTGAPYPQLFPKLLAFCYQLLGNIELQLPVKATLIVFPWALLTGIAMIYRQLGIVYIVGLIYVLWGVGLAQFFDDGYADPIMTSALGVSAVLLWLSQSRLSSLSFYFGILSVLSAWICAHAKQAGLLWTGFALPILWILAYYRGKDKRYFILAFLSLIGAVIWMGSEGQAFHHNEGVLWLSFGERGILKQLLYSIDRYFVHQPLLLGLFVYACWVAQKNTLLKQILFLFLIPGWICWFLFGAYQLRLGQHLIAMVFFMIVASHSSLRGCFSPKQFRKDWIASLRACNDGSKISIFKVGRVYIRTTLNLGKAANERSPRNEHLVHQGGERAQPTQHKFKVGRVYTQTTLNLGKAANERSPRSAHLVHDGGERVQPTQHKFKVERVYLGLVVVSIVISGVLFVKEVYFEKGGISLYQGGRQSLHRYFGADADYIYQQIYLNPDQLLWVPSRYIYGLFYKHTQLTSPDYALYAEYNAGALIDELKRKSPDYVFTVSKAVIDGPASEILGSVIEQCPRAFKKVSGPENRFNFITYKLNKTILGEDPCLLTLAQGIYSAQCKNLGERPYLR